MILAASLSGASPSGTWASEGYGLVFEIAGDALESFEVTKVSCLPSTKASAVAYSRGGARRVSGGRGSDDPSAPSRLPAGPDAPPPELGGIRHRASKDRTEARRLSEAASERPRRELRRVRGDLGRAVPVLPDEGSRLAGDCRAQPREDRRPDHAAELFGVLEGMIAPFEDAHTFIGAEVPGSPLLSREKESSLGRREERERAYGLVTKYLARPLRSFCEGKVEFGMLDPTSAISDSAASAVTIPMAASRAASKRSMRRSTPPSPRPNPGKDW